MLSNKELMKRLVEGIEGVIDFETEVGTFKLRAMSIGERSHVKTIPMRAVKVIAQGNADPRGPQDFKVNVNMDELQKSEDDVKFTVIAYGLTINQKEKFTVEQVKQMRVSDEVVKSLYLKVLELSEMEEKDLAPFHEQLRKLIAQNVNTVGAQASQQSQ